MKSPLIATIRKKVCTTRAFMTGQVRTMALVVTALILAACNAQSPTEPKGASLPLYQDMNGRAIDFNFGWQFSLSDDPSYAEVDVTTDGDKWQTVRLPHDWSIKQPFSEEWDGATGYLPGGIGWYRKHFSLPKAQQGKKQILYFDGIYANSEVWVNGHKVGQQRNGYTPHFYDITKYLNYGAKKNLVAVRVDHKNYIDSRWYTGSGIYRNVTLYQVDKLHVPIWGTYVTTPKVDAGSAKVQLQTTIRNDYEAQAQFDVMTSIIAPNGHVVTTQKSPLTLASGEQHILEQGFEINRPQLWDITDPNLYVAQTQIIKNGKVLDLVDTQFGIRTLKYDPERGFFLNDRSLKIKGVNVHHGAGSVGTAVPLEVWRRRLEILQEAGVNAIRAAHNPISADLLQLCDEMGILVQSEIFDEWDNPKDKRLNQWERHDDEISRGYAEHFQTDAEFDLKNAVLRDRNHPSIIMWSIGNEIEWTYPRYKAATGYFDMNAAGNYFYNPPFISPEEIVERFHSSKEEKYVLAKTAKKLSNWVKELDQTRPVTANLILPSVSHISGYTDALDIVGYSYRRVIYDYGHRLFPDKMIMGTENVVHWHEWQAIEERPFIAGTFLWTGIDYLGEAHNQWPNKGFTGGMLDTAGFKKPGFHMMKSLWHSEPHIKLTTQTVEKSIYKMEGERLIEKKENGWQRRVWGWHDVELHWNYTQGELIAIEALTNCPSVELFVDGRSVGVQHLKDNPDHILKWAVPFTAGEIKAQGLNGCTALDSIKSAKSVSAIELQADKPTVSFDGYDVAHISAQLLDENGVPIRHEEASVVVNVSSNAEIIGMDNGHFATMEDYNSSTVKTHNGQFLTIVRALDQQPFTLTYQIGKDISKTLVIDVQ